MEDFEAVVTWVIGLDRQRAFNVFQLDGPDRLVIDVGPPTTPAPPPTSNVRAHFTPEGSLATRCDVVEGVSRLVPGATPLTNAVHELLEGPNVAESDRGLVSPFSRTTATHLNGIAIRNRTAYVDFTDFSRQLPNASTSCGSAQLLAQLDATVTQFPTVDAAVYSFDGDVGAFYGWLQLSPP